jgi:phosphoribosyl 1,2-cyclic phosphodiesterase
MVSFLSLISGSSGNAIYLSDGRTKLLVDCGMSGKKLKEALERIDVSPEDLDALLLTHEHIDHVKGAGVVARRYHLPVYATEGTHLGMDAGKIKDEQIKIIPKNISFEIGTIGVNAFSIPHDAADPVGYNFFAENKKLSIATDIGDMTDEIEQSILGSEMVLLESNHDLQMLQMGSYPFYLKQRILSDHGHLCNDAAAETAVKLLKSGTKHILLGHLSRENNRPDIAYKVTENLLSSVGAAIGSDITLNVASRSEITCFG